MRVGVEPRLRNHDHTHTVLQGFLLITFMIRLVVQNNIPNTFTTLPKGVLKKFDNFTSNSVDEWYLTQRPRGSLLTEESWQITSHFIY